MLDEVERGSVDIAVARLDAREQPGALVEDAAEEHHEAQHIGLVDASQHAGPALRLAPLGEPEAERSEEHTSELQSLMRISYAVLCLKKKQHKQIHTEYHQKNVN